MNNNQPTSFVTGAAILSIAAFVGKLLSAVYRIPYQNITGNEGMYVYQQVYPLYSVLLLLATAGFPLAISKLVAERLREGNGTEAHRIFTTSLITLGIAGVIFFILLFLGAETIAAWMGSPELLTMPIQAVSFAFLIVPILSAFRGYYQGYQDMVPTAVSQMTEQVVRVITILIAASFFMTSGWGVVYAGAGAVLGASTGGIAALFVFLYFWRKRRIHVPLSSLNTKKQSAGNIVRQILSLSLPICFVALVYPLFGLVDSFTIGNRLMMIGNQPDEAIVMKGVFDRGQPLIQFGSFFATAISLSLVPAISGVVTRNKGILMNKQIQVALRITWLIGLPASLGLAIVALPINVMFFQDSLGTEALQILAFSTLFSTLVITSSSILQGSGKVYQPVWHLLVGVIGKVGLNWMLIPAWGIQGAALATVLSYAVVAVLNLVSLKMTGLTWREGRSILWAISCFVAGTICTTLVLYELTNWLFSYRLAMMVTSLVTVLIGVLIYTWAMFRFRLLQRSEIEQSPKLKKWLLPILDKWGFR